MNLVNFREINILINLNFLRTIALSKAFVFRNILKIKLYYGIFKNSYVTLL